LRLGLSNNVVHLQLGLGIYAVKSGLGKPAWFESLVRMPGLYLLGLTRLALLSANIG